MNWNKVKLSEVTTILGDGLHGTPRYDPNGEYYFINGSNLLNGKIVTSDKDKKVSYQEYLKYKKNLNDRTILVSINGTLGNVAIYNNEKIILGKSACYFNIKENIDKLFIKYVISSPFFKAYIHNLSTGTTIKNVSLKLMRDFEFYLPNLHIQKKISNILGTLDNKIDLNTQINQTLEQIAQALFKSWFVDFDPVRAKVQALSDGLSLEQAELAAMQAISGKTPEELTALSQAQPDRYAELAETAKAFPCEMVEVDGVKVPKGWEVTPLSGLFTLISGTQIPKEEHIYEAKEGYERFIQNRDYSSNNHITYVEISKKNKRCTEKDILIDRYGDAGKIRFGISGVYNIALAKIVLNDNNLTEYLRWFLMQPKQKAYFEQASGASTRASLNTSTFKGINVVIPSNFILNIFSKISNTYLDSLRNLKEENNTLMKTRDSLLPKLLKQDV